MDFIACILNIYPDAKNISCTGRDYSGIQWDDPRGVPTLEQCNLAWAAIKEQRRVASIKTEAQARIYAIAPQWKQANFTARSVELTYLKVSRTLTAEEQSEWDAMTAIWDRVKAIRAHSGELEVDERLKSSWPE